MRFWNWVVAACLLAGGIGWALNAGDLPAMVATSGFLMYVAVAVAFLLPILRVGGKGRIVTIICINVFALGYADGMPRWFNQRQVEEISDSVAKMAQRRGEDLSEDLSHVVRWAHLGTEIQCGKAMSPLYFLVFLDVVWLASLLYREMATDASTSVGPSSEEPLNLEGT